MPFSGSHFLMRFVCDVCGNKSYKNVTDYTNHLDSYDHHHAKRMVECVACPYFVHPLCA